MIRWSLSLADYWAFRDDYSRQLASRIGVSGESIVCPDQAFCIDGTRYRKQRPARPSRVVVGVAPIAYCDPRHWSRSDEGAYRTYIGKMASFVAWLLEAGYDVLYFHTQVHGDDRAVADVNELLAKRALPVDRIKEHRVQWYTDALEALADVDVVVASRFHAILFSCIMGRAAIGLSYDPKIDNVMRALGQSEFVFDIEQFQLDQLAQALARLVERRAEIVAAVSAKSAEFRDALEKQYDTVFH
jgi:polysaccharide pyruvyl transferase WcaK-like protein